MNIRNSGTVVVLLLVAVSLAVNLAVNFRGHPLTAADPPAPFVLIVMDPLALPLSCPCVKGYAQRDYEKFAKHLAQRIGRPVKVEFDESLTHALKSKTEGRADLIIGKHSVVQAESHRNQLDVEKLALLTGKDGSTTQSGLFVVAASDPALTVADLKEHRLILGSADADEKHSAAISLLKLLSVPVPEPLETCAACSDGATKIIELHKNGERAATVISSYAKPLLEGCGTIQKGDLRVVGETEPVPFVGAFINKNVLPSERQIVRQTLMDVAKSASLRDALETRAGFVAVSELKKKN